MVINESEALVKEEMNRDEPHVVMLNMMYINFYWLKLRVYGCGGKTKWATTCGCAGANYRANTLLVKEGIPITYRRR